MRSIRAGLMMVMFPLLTSCTSSETTIPCHRYEAGHLGRDSDFQLTVPAGEIPLLDASRDRMTLSLSLLPPLTDLTTRATLIHTIGGREVAKWNLKLPVPYGISARCTIGAARPNSNCGASLTDLPYNPAGTYYLKSDSARLIEAGLSFYVCE